jgi:uncharacterized protein (TIGR00369 family)
MKEQIRTLLENCLEEATSEEQEVLADMLKGFNKKQKKINSSYIGGLLHMERTMDDEICELTIPLTSLANNPLGIVHGGITATIIDSAMGTLANSLLPEGFGAVTTQLNIHYLSVGKGAYLHCKAHIDHKGTKTMVLSAEVTRADGKRIAQATGSFYIIKKR